MASDTSLLFNILAKDQASKTFSKVKAVAIASVAAIGAAALKFGIDSVKAFSEAQQSQVQLQDAFAKFPNLADTNIDKLGALNSALALKTKFDDDAIGSGEALLARFKLTGTQIQQLTPLLVDYAAKTGKEMPDAAGALGKALMGSGRAMKELGLNFKDTGSIGGNFTEIMTGLQAKVGGFAEQQGKSAAGQAAILTNQFGELQEQVGGLLVPALLRLVNPLRDVLSFMQNNASVIMKVAGVLGALVGIVWTINAAVKAYTAVQAALNVVMSLNPIGAIIIAVVALIGVIVYLATKTKFFQTVWSYVWTFLKAVGAWFAGPFINFFKRAYAFISGLVTGYFNFYVNTWKKIFSFIAGIPHKVTALSKGMWNGLVNAFKGAINFIIGAWNALDFSINISIPSWVPGIGGKGLFIPDVIPDIPYLASGGIVRARPGGTVVGVGEGGRDEAVIPLPRGGQLFGDRRITIDLRGSDEAFKRFFREILRKNPDLVVVG